MKKKNVVVFLTDDQRYDTIHELGNSAISTPNIDELVRRGTAFTNAHIPGGTVGAVCMPSRAMLNTGRSLFHIERHGREIPEEHKLMGESFREAGYRTFGTGKWHNGVKSFVRSFTDGSEIYFGGMNDHWNVPAYDFDPSGEYSERSRQCCDFYYSNQIIENICDHITPGKHSSELFCDAASEWVDNYEGDKPFFMYISFMAPHDPRSMPEEFRSMYSAEEIELPENFIGEHSFDFGISDVRDELLAPYPRTEKDIKKHIAEYYGMISHLDNELGKVIASLKKTGKYDNTVVIFTADNGLAVGQHGLMGKQSAYEHSVRVPLILSGPGIPENEKRDAFVYLSDIYPTLCEILGMEIPESVDSLSFLPCINNSSQKIRESLYLAYADLVRAVKNKRYKLVEYRNKGLKATQLFDLQNDPLEINDLSDENDHKETVYELKNLLLKYREEWDDDKTKTGMEFWSRY